MLTLKKVLTLFVMTTNKSQAVTRKYLEHPLKFGQREMPKIKFWVICSYTQLQRNPLSLDSSYFRCHPRARKKVEPKQSIPQQHGQKDICLKVSQSPSSTECILTSPILLFSWAEWSSLPLYMYVLGYVLEQHLI